MELTREKLNLFRDFPQPLAGDWLVMLAGLCLVVYLGTRFWQFSAASHLEIQLNGQILGKYSLNQTKTLRIHGKNGDSIIQIAQGRARFLQSPCSNQYCVHQGWLSKTGQAAACLPNQISLALMGEKPAFDSLNY